MSNIQDFQNDESSDFNSTAFLASTTPGQIVGSLGATVPQPASPGRWDKLTIINQALINTANNTVAIVDDGSDEWRAASSLFDQWLDTMLYRRDWKFATQISSLLARLGDSPFPGYGDVFAKPVDCLYLVNVWRQDLAALVLPALFGAPSEEYNTEPPPLDYAIIGAQIHTTAELGAICQYVPYSSPQMPWSTGFVAALRLKIEAGLYRSLNEDFSEANRADKEGEAAMTEAAARDDGEEPRRVAFRSRLTERRRTRRYGAGYY